jgi:CHAT domain-containing protein/Tfp pilus assembly protein PilF
MIKRICQLVLLLCLASTAFAQVKDEVRPLVPGQSVEREITGGQSHTYQINLTSGQFMRVVVEQRGIDVKLALSSSDGKPLVESDLTGIIGAREPLSYEAAAAGTYQLVVRANGAANQSGAYVARLEVKTSASAQDRKRIAAESLLNDAARLTADGKYTDPQLSEKLGQALGLFQELDDRYLQGLTLNLMGNAYNGSRQYDKAIGAYEQALPLWRGEKLRAGEATLISNIGDANRYLGNYEDAIRYYEQALVATREVKDRAFESTVLSSLGMVYRWLGRSDKAIEYYQQALDLSRADKNRKGEQAALGSMGIAYQEWGKYEKAIECGEQALAIARELKSREHYQLINLGIVYSRMGRMEKATEYFSQALAIAREKKLREFEATPLANLAVVEARLGHSDKAIDYLEQALVINRETKDRRNEAGNLYNLGVRYENLGRIDKAIEYYRMHLAIQRELRDAPAVAWALFGLARIERNRDLPAARAYIEESLKINEALRRNLMTPESRTQHSATVLYSYKLYTEVLMRQHHAEPMKGFDALAVEVSERQRARSLLDLLTEARADVRQGVDAALLERERSLGKQLDDKAGLLTRANKPEQADALKKEISQLETEYERAQAAIRKASPNYAALTQPEPVKLNQIQQQLDAETVLLEYSLGAPGQEQSYLWAITRDSLTTYELPKGDLIEKSAREVYELLTARSTSTRGETAAQRQGRISEAEAKLPDAARGLSQTILAPVAAQLGNKRLVVVADGALQYIPFAMLPEPSVVSGQLSVAKNNGPRTTDNREPLIVKHEVVSIPSASALAIQRSELAGRQPAPKMLAVIADPVFDRSDSRFTTLASDTGEKAQTQTITADDARSIEHLSENSGDKSKVTTIRMVIPRLPFTRQEANQLMALAPKGSSFRAIDFQASRATMLDPALSQYRYVHIATHGLLDTERPGLSALVFSMVDAEGKPQNGFLRANDIYNLKLPAELVVLSACQTGLGKDIKGEGLVGLTRGFMYAGAARVVVSLWNVNDKATADLMAKFYEKMLKRGQRPAAALRAAQVEMWKQKQWQSPYYWAAFTMQGEWR